MIDRLAANHIDLTKMPVEVAPIAHYHMGGIAVDTRMATGIPGLFAAGEAVGGANGANRLSGNAMTEALVFGRRAGASAAAHAAAHTAQPFRQHAARDAVALATAGRETGRDQPNSADLIVELQNAMADEVGPFRTGAKLERAIARLERLSQDIGERPFGDRAPFDMPRIDWLDLRNMVLVARTVAQTARLRTESRGAHQREDFPGMLPEWRVNQVVRRHDGRLDIAPQSPVELAEEPGTGPGLAAAQ